VTPPPTTPVTFIVFGATGDLFARKIIPSLYFLYTKKKIPETFLTIGFGRHPHTTDTFREHIFVQLIHVAPSITLREAQPFLNLFTYHHGEFTDGTSFTSLKEKLRANDATHNIKSVKSFYLAVPPELVEVLVPRIAHISDGDGESRNIIIEKPFGKNEKTARALNEYLEQFFDEKEIFRIDHYLAKPGLDRLLHTRTNNSHYEELLGAAPVRSVEVTLFEEMGVEKRGAFYDGVGAFRDIGQNHLLEMLALALMPIPELTSEKICSAREAFIKALPRLNDEAVVHQTTRGQYETYTTIKGVNPHSQVETYFDVQFSLEESPYHGVPVRLRGGKRMSRIQKDVVITVDSPHADSLHIELEPIPRIYAKKGSLITPIAEFVDPEPTIQYANEYAQLFVYAWTGDFTLFPTRKEIEYAWRFTDPIIETWEKGLPKLHFYPPNSDALPQN